MVAVLRTEGLTKHFGRFKAVDGVDLDVQEGDIYGFLGLNGAGKTTTLRMILRLIRPTAGRVSIFGLDPTSSFIEVMKQVGCLVELPAYYPYLTGWKNLEILRLATGGIERKRIDDVLDIVGLGARKHDAVRTYSQGMRQRLGIAMALLPRPRLVLLDEPTNGLDPQGIHHIREAIRDLNRRDGVTFVVSSHLLHEVEITCNRVGILKQGKILLQDTVARILEKTLDGVRVVGDPQDKAREALRRQPWIAEVSDAPGGGLRVRCDPSRFADLNRLLVQEGVSVRELSPVRRTLEEYFLST
ncbi:MAG TPA: ABC transporter ATP-binding protein [Planctomycetota bacterium]|nr:ABC transporter ATP-binding protein [Planctomycetota bacterium]